MTRADFDWDNLRYFLAVARSGRLTAAARVLGQDHTTVSRRIAALEAAFGSPLFERQPQGYRLTKAGTQLLSFAENIERTTIRAAKELSGASAAISGSVRIGAPDGFGGSFLGPRLGRIVERHPDLQVELIAMPRVFSLSKREADIAIGLNCPKEGRLYARKLTDYRLVLYAAPSYVAAHGLPQSVAELQQHRLIGYADEYIFSPELDYLPLISPGLKARIRSSNLIAQLHATIAGAGICVLPCFMAAPYPDLVHVLPGQVALDRTFWLITHADLHDVAWVKAAGDFIAEMVQAERGLFMPG
ncbi:LysR family transcriptional regulator [Ferrovibrio sp.]|uniref:LysR family transcriptional regulator n=1 Tax=Ferrovibrio sp. TaxID=1917215 RepID=UPI001B4C996C|nr:LysR family transcriptional regulator [Ferrovibrio sp.]MBP7062552.1 LysR family transcriptional regulator [Ferrovibrio sp.]